MPDIQFINSPRTEEERYKMTAKVIASGFYQKHGFVVVPELVKGLVTTSQVIYPAKQVYESVEVEKFEKEWCKVGEKFWEYLDELLPSSRFHGNIEVRVSKFGTVSSSATIGEHNKERVVYYLRIDADLSHLAAMIINKILYSERKNLGITWTKREALMDFIMTRPPMRKLFPGFEPVFSQLSRVSAKIRKESEEYVRSLGISSARPEFAMVGGKIVIKGKIVGKELTKLEKKILKTMIERQGELVSYDELADTVWGVGEFKTFWAINKLVGRLRPRLAKLGVEQNRLESVRGQGYLLN